MQKIKVVRIFSQTFEAPFDEDYYGDLDIERACQQEEQPDADEAVQLLGEDLDSVHLLSSHVTIVTDPA